MENVVYTDHSLTEAIILTHIAYIKFHFIISQCDPHVFLLFLITGEDADLANAGIEKTFQHRMPEGAGTTSDHQYFVVKHL
ncbi:hypothetical protein D3C80_1850310 [compost metagenome]